jgi:hypothetical protein
MPPDVANHPIQVMKYDTAATGTSSRKVAGPCFSTAALNQNGMPRRRRASASTTMR